MSAAGEQPIYAFEGFHLDAQHRVLSDAGGEIIPLAPKVFDTLLYFVEHAGELLDKRTLLEAIWSNTVVEENNLNQAVSTLRRVLGEHPGDHRFIVTEPGRGYRFVATVRIRAAERPAEPRPGEAALERSSPAPGNAARLERRSYVAAAAAIVLALAGIVWYVQDSDGGRLPNSVAVLPFENLSPNVEDAFIAAGLHGEILNQLTKVAALNVIGQPSMLRYVDTEKSIREIGAELNVETVLDTSVRYAEGRIRITSILVDAATGRNVWSETYEEAFDDVFAIESHIAMEIANALSAEFTPTEQQAIGTPPTKSPEAYQAYLRV